MRIAAIILTTGLALAAGSGRAEPAGSTPLRAYAEQALNEWRVPGMAIAVVRDDAVILAEGYGVRRLGEAEPVGVDTVFAIGSNAKAFTAALAAMKVDAGRMAWDGPVVRYLPDFQLADPWITREVTIRDFLVHRAGLSRGDMLWHGSGLERADIVRRLRWLPQRLPFRSRYDYNNLGYVVVGQALAATSGESWDDQVRTRLFQPLGMTRSSTSISALESMDDTAAPHWIEKDAVTVMPRMNLDDLGPAGSINSSAADMARWLRFQLADGRFEGRVVAPARTLRVTRAAQVSIPAARDELFPSTHFGAYGMGWSLFDYRRRLVLQHTGGVDGMQSEMVLVPEERLGFVILTNARGSRSQRGHALSPSRHVSGRAGAGLERPAPRPLPRRRRRRRGSGFDRPASRISAAPPGGLCRRLRRSALRRSAGDPYRRRPDPGLRPPSPADAHAAQSRRL